ncbi:MAG TPA: ATP-binding protein [Anaerolineae bacterium]|nr:ATP-binding protein [Anaerolineae bacterium]
MNALRGKPAASASSSQLDELKAEHAQAQRELKEIDLLIQQTSAEVDRLAQRNAQATNRVKQLEINLDTVPRGDLQKAYTEAQEAQKRLFMMRGQLEKLQSDQQHLSRLTDALRRSTELLSETPGLGGLGAGEDGEGADTSQPAIVRIIETQEQERQRLVRQLHDGPAQSLTNLILQAEICERLFDNDAKRARSELGNLKTAVTGTFQKVRDFMFDLRPMMLDDLGLVPTLKRYVDSFAEKSGIPISLTVTGNERRFTGYKEMALFRIVQDLLSNVRQHSHATRAQVLLDLTEDAVRVTVEDNGSGFDVSETLSAKKGIGLSTLRERVEMMGGQVQIDSAPGRGTKVGLLLPLP